MTPVALLVIAKAPVPGKVKTRLTPPCSGEQAAALARAALADTLAAVAAVGGRRGVLVLDGEPGPQVPEDVEVIAQHGEGFAARLANAFADVGAPAVLVGMDTPQVSSELLEAACEALEAPGTDAVLGLAEDGGFWLLGLRRADRAVFDGVPMSDGSTGAAQQARLAALGLCVAAMPSLRDVDTIEDARAVAAGAPRTAFAAELAAIEGHVGHPG